MAGSGTKGNKVKGEERSGWLEGSGLEVAALSLKDSLQTAIFVFFVLKKRTLSVQICFPV